MSTRILIPGASHGSLIATRLLMAGHIVTLDCMRSTAELINREGTVARFPIKGWQGLLQAPLATPRGTRDACTPEAAGPAEYDLVHSIARRFGVKSAPLQEIVRLVDDRLAQNRRAERAAA